jgi:hypothetical protein
VENGLHCVSKCIRHGLLTLQCVCVCVTERDRVSTLGRARVIKVCSKIGYVTRNSVTETSYEFSGCSVFNLYYKIVTFRVNVSYSRSAIHFSHS